MKRIQTKFGSSWKVGTIAVLVAATAGIGCKSGGGTTAGSTGEVQVPPGAVDNSVERYKVPVGDAPVRGPADAKVTIVEWSDFQCPFCGRVEGTLQQIQKTYGNDVRLVWKNNPLPFHPHAMPAAEAAMAAKAQGKFWEMHDLLFKNQQALEQSDLDKYAQQVGLNITQYKADVAAHKYKAEIQADIAQAAKFGARGTPSFFINGRPLSGAQPFASFKKVIDEEIAAADKAIKAGVKPADVYAALTKNGKDAAASPAQAQRQPPPLDPTVYKVPIGDSPQRGPKDAEITIVEFSDFQCPFCGRVEGTLQQIIKTYGNDVRLVWKNNPLPFHQHAMPAAEAAMAAKAQGKFWEMHDLLFKNQQALERADLDKYAQQIGLNMAKYKAAMDGDKYKKEIQADIDMAANFGARGTPSFFINGHSFRGAQPFENFKKVIDQLKLQADATVAKGTAKADLYAELTKDGKTKAELPPMPRQPPADNTVYKALIGDAPVRGAKNAKVTIVEWSDFQCPFCGRAEGTLEQVLKAYPKDVRIAYKEFPLPFHNHAHMAAEAALAAKAQGKFWQMHDILFKNQQTLDRAGLEKHAQEAGLDMAKFKAALDSGKYKAEVDKEAAEGSKIGTRGTPTFYINGKQFVGAQPFPAFKARIDEAIKDANDLIAKKHVKAAKLYDYLMKDAKDSVPAAPTPAAAAAPDDKTVYHVDPGNGPSKGPTNAPVTIVEFSDFQCPFCGRVVPTVEQIWKTYGNKIHFVWRNYPLPFHPHAEPAAEAAMAANAQGKFWPMFQKIYANQQTLDRAHFEQWGQEIGLDMNKFKSDLDNHTYKAEVEADVKYGNSLPGGGMGTPTFYINGRKIAGAYPFEAFKKVIDEELAKKK